MTTSYAPATSEMITLTELLGLFDAATGYGIDRHSRAELAKLEDKNKHKHVTDAKTAHGIVERYIDHQFMQRNDRPPKTEHQRNSVVRSNGFSHDTTYDRDDILRMLDDHYVHSLLRDEFHERTVVLQGIYIPTIVAATHPIDPANQKEEDWFY